MRNFLRLAEGVDVQPMLLALYRQPQLWNQITFRTDWPDSPHREVSDILLRVQRRDGTCTDRRECIDYPAYAAFPQVRRFVAALMAQVEGERLGRVLFTCLPPGRKIYPHEDIGPTAIHYDTEPYYSRFHLCLQAAAESVFCCGDEVCHMAPGEVYWFNNALTHWVENGSDTLNRLHLIVDIHCATVPV